VDPYAEGVTFRSPGQAKPLAGVAPPWETVHSESITLKALHSRFRVTRVLVERLQRTGFLGLGTQGAQPVAASPRCLRPWAPECNRFAVQSLAALPSQWKSTEKMHNSVTLRGLGSRFLLKSRGLTPPATFCRRYVARRRDFRSCTTALKPRTRNRSCRSRINKALLPVI
jgi:hypothetical protein